MSLLRETTPNQTFDQYGNSDPRNSVKIKTCPIYNLFQVDEKHCQTVDDIPAKHMIWCWSYDHDDDDVDDVDDRNRHDDNVDDDNDDDDITLTTVTRLANVHPPKQAHLEVPVDRGATLRPVLGCGKWNPRKSTKITNICSFVRYSTGNHFGIPTNECNMFQLGRLISAVWGSRQCNSKVLCRDASMSWNCSLFCSVGLSHAYPTSPKHPQQMFCNMENQQLVKKYHMVCSRAYGIWCPGGFGCLSLFACAKKNDFW